VNPLIKKGISLGVGALIDYLRTEKPLRTWIRARRAKKGKPPIVGSSVDRELERALDFAEKEAAKKIKN
jgi:hypothetical protein